MVCSPFVYDSNEKGNTLDDNFCVKERYENKKIQLNC